MDFKEILKMLRAKKGITQEKLARDLDIPSSTIRRYESSEDGLPNRSRLNLIADYFGVTVDYLMGRDEVEAYEMTETDKNEIIIKEIVTKYDIDLSVPGTKEKLEKIIQIVADDLRLSGKK